MSDRSQYYPFERYLKHIDGCAGGGDQACQCGMASVRFNLEQLIEDRDLAEMRRQRDHAISVLAELHALVLGECPRLLDEDRDGDAKLDAAIYAILTPKEPRDG